MQTSFFPNRLFLIALVGIAQILPAEDLGVRVADYVGIWRVKGSMYNGGDENVETENDDKSENGNDTSNGVFFRIGADGSGSVFHINNGRAVPDGALRWTEGEGGIRCMDVGGKPEVSNEDRYAYAMRYDANTETILVNHWHNRWRMERANGVEDPADALREMMRSRSYCGCWTGGDMFGKFTVAFDPDGNGFSSAFMWAAPFVWAADTNGNIKMTIPLPYGEATNAVARYDAATDTMHLQEMGKAQRDREFNLEHPEHPARDMLDELTKRYREANIDGEMALARHLAQHHLMFTNESARMHFNDLESALSWLQTPGDSNGVSRQIVFESISTNWSDSITYKPGSGFSASLGTGYFERGKRPPESELSAMNWMQTQRPGTLPPPQVENLDGIDDLERICARYEKAYVDGDAKVFAEMLRPRFGPLFPRDAQTAITRILKRGTEDE